LLNPREKSLFQRKVSYDNLPDDVLERFNKQFSRQAQNLLERADKWLAKHDRDINPSIEESGRNKTGFGIFFFQEPYSEEG
jgi:hypothetical protein